MKNLLRPLALATQLGVTMALMTITTVVAGLFLGLWVDRQFGTRPFATLLFILMGVLAGLLGMVNLAHAAARQLDDAAALHVEARAAYSTHDLGRALLFIVELVAVTLGPVGLGLWLGLSVDRLTGARPAFTIALSAVSIVGAMLGVYCVSQRAARHTGRNP